MTPGESLPLRTLGRIGLAVPSLCVGCAALGDMPETFAYSVAEEQALRNKASLDPSEKQELAALEVDLDQCWDLLRQRRALREMGQSTAAAHVRPAAVVEKYEG